MQQDIRGQVALVTGAAHRVGRAIAVELARLGAHIVLHYGGSAPDVVDEALDAVRAHGVEAWPVQADLTTPPGVEALFAAVDAQAGRLHILVNSASNFLRRDLLALTPDEWQQTLALNLTAPLLCTQAAAPRMARNDPPGGVIVNILDRGAEQPWPDYAGHGISKAGLAMLSRTSAIALGPSVRVNAVLPGPVLKPKHLSEEAWHASGQRTVLKRTGAPEDVARAVGYLVQEDYLTGATIHVDGGAHLLER